MPKIKRIKSDILRTLDQAMRSGGIDSWSNYIGDHEFDQWYLCAGHSRDSTVLEESNYQSILRDLIADFGEEGIYERSVNHWAVGWIEEILIDPTNEKLVRRVEEIQEGLEEYPVYDDNDFSEKENEEQEESWNNYGESDFRDLLEAKFEIDFDNVEKEDLDDKLYEFCFSYLDVMAENHDDGVYYDFEKGLEGLDKKEFFLWKEGYFKAFQFDYEFNGKDNSMFRL